MALLRHVFDSSVEVDPPRVESMACFLFTVEEVDSSANAAGSQFRVVGNEERERRKGDESERDPKAAVWPLASKKEMAEDEIRMALNDETTIKNL